MKSLFRGLSLFAAVLSQSALAAPFAYIAQWGGARVEVIDTATDQIVTYIPVGAGPNGVAVGPGGDRVYVTNSWDSTVTVIDGKTQSAIATIAVTPYPRCIAVSDDGKHVLAASSSKPEVTLIDADTLTVVGSITVPVSAMPNRMTFVPDFSGFAPGKGHFLAAYGGSLVEIKRDLQIGSIHKLPNASSLTGLLAQPPYIYTADWNSGTVARTYYDEQGVWYAPETFKLSGGMASGLAYTLNRSNPASPFGMLISGDPNGNTLAMLSLRVSPWQQIASVPMDIGVVDIGVTPAGNKAYVVDDTGVSIIDVYSQHYTQRIALPSGTTALGQFIRPVADHVPNPYAFTPVNNAAVSSGLLRPNVVISNSVVLAGYDRATPVSITCPAGDLACGFSIDGGEWTKGPASISPGSSIRVRVKASTQPGTTTKAVLDAGGRRAEFAVTTQYKRGLLGG